MQIEEHGAWQRLLVRLWGASAALYAFLGSFDVQHDLIGYAKATRTGATDWWRIHGECDIARLLIHAVVAVVLLAHASAVLRLLMPDDGELRQRNAILLVRLWGIGFANSAMLFLINFIEHPLLMDPAPDALGWVMLQWATTGKLLILGSLAAWFLLGSRFIASWLDRPTRVSVPAEPASG